MHFIHKRINQLIGAVGLLEVRANFPNFNLLEDEIKAIDRKIIQTRADRGKLDGNYDAILVEHSEKLLKFYKELESSELAIRQALLAQKQRNRRNLWIASGVGFLLGIVGSVIASNLDRWIVSTSEKQQKTPATAPSPSLKQP